MKKSASQKTKLWLAGLAVLAIVATAVGLSSTNTSDLQGQFSLSRSDFVTRGEFAQVVSYQVGIISQCTGSTQTFSDVPTFHPFYCGAEMMNQFGLMQGYSTGQFNPEGFLPRAEAAKIYFSALNPPSVTPSTPSFPDVSPSVWYYEAVESMNAYGLFNTTGNFNPSSNLKWNAFAAWSQNL